VNNSENPQAKPSASLDADARSRLRRRLAGLCVLLAVLGVTGTIFFGDPAEPPGSPPPSASRDDADQIQLGEREEASRFVPPQHDDTWSRSTGFMNPSGYDNSLQTFGRESTEAEFREAADALHGYLDARVVGNWAAACQYLDDSFVDIYLDTDTPLEKSLGAVKESGRGCAAALWFQSHKVPDDLLEEEADVDIGSLRIAADKGYLLFHTSDGTKRSIGVIKKDGHWKLYTINSVPF
jgi:hypothetical protein